MRQFAEDIEKERGFYPLVGESGRARPAGDGAPLLTSEGTMRRNRRPERYADEGRLRTYRIVTYGNIEDEELAEFALRLMNTLHYSRQPSHVEFATTPEGFVEQKITTDMALPNLLGPNCLVEDVTLEIPDD